MTRIDVIVAVRDEEQSIPVFLQKIAALPLPPEVELKVVFVEDSSTDATRPLLRRLAREDRGVGYYSLVRGFGQGLAVTFGLSRSDADAMIMLDVDGSHPVEVIPEMIDAYRHGAHVVQCVRRSLANRKAYRSAGARLYAFGAQLLTGIDATEQNIFYRLVSADIVRQLLQQPRYWTYLRFPLPRRPEGALRKIYVDTEERQLGESKYGFRRLVRLAIDGVLSQMPAARLGVFVGVAVALVWWLWAVALWPLAVAIAGGTAWLLFHYQRLSRPDALERIEVLECGNVPGM